MQQQLLRLLPGSSNAIHLARLQILDFVSSLTGRTVLLRGPVGAGKSTVARVLGLFKRLAPLSNEEASRIVSDLKFDGHNRVDLRSMPWYVELTLTGLVEGLAEAQLFGSTKGAYTGAVDRAGVFERAIRGHSRKGSEPIASLLTGGVVFLDEIGDLEPVLQAKLLPVLSGAPFYRVGGEGHSEYELQFRGIMITASWRRLDSSRMRPDLMSRISAYVVDVPGLGERHEDFEEVLAEVERNVLGSFEAAIDYITQAEPHADRVYWRGRKDLLGPLSSVARRRLKAVDWSQRGNLRGLTAAVEQLLGGQRDLDQVIEELPLLEHGPERTQYDPPDLLHRLLNSATSGDGLAGNVRRLEVEQRVALRQRLLSDYPTRRQLAAKLEIDERRLVAQVHQLDRRRRRMGGEQ
jgi:arginine utilization regulatory protein